MAAAALAAALLAACAPEVNLHGSQLSAERLAQIRPGEQTREQISKLLGSPTSVATFSDDTWYYVSARTRTVTYHEPETLSRDVIAIRFDESGRVADVTHYTLADGRRIELVERETPTPGREFTLLQQLFGNLGRFEGSGEANLDSFGGP